MLLAARWRCVSTLVDGACEWYLLMVEQCWLTLLVLAVCLQLHWDKFARWAWLKDIVWYVHHAGICDGMLAVALVKQSLAKSGSAEFVIGDRVIITHHL